LIAKPSRKEGVVMGKDPAAKVVVLVNALKTIRKYIKSQKLEDLAEAKKVIQLVDMVCEETLHEEQVAE
jgi:hypothetical protein